MKILSRNLKALFMEAVHKAYPDLSMDEVLRLVNVEEPREAAHGDYATGLAMRLTKVVGEAEGIAAAGAAVVAEAVMDAFAKDYRVEKLEFAAPGFINVRLSATYLQEALKQLESGFSVEQEGARHDRPVIVEYSGTNAAKHMGVHHVITTILGAALASLFEFMGYNVIRINHLGDWGTHFGKILYAIETWGDRAVIQKNPNDEITKLYVQFNQKEEEDPRLIEEARRVFKELEEGDAHWTELWKWVVSESLKDLQKIFTRLGISFDHITGESFYLGMTEEVLKEGVAKGVFVKGEGGALIAPLGEDKVPALLQKADGATLYLTRDVATVKYRVETWHPEAILYVVDHAQSLHFQQDFAVARALGYAEDSTLEHISFGRMNFKDKTMSTRKGNVIKLSEVLDEAAKRAGTLAAEKSVDFPREELYAMAEVVGVASVKYAVLSQDRNKDILFDWDKIISLDGNSAPYLLYSYARAATILHKAGTVDLSGLPQLTEEAELDVVRRLVKLPDALERALMERKPHIVSTALYELCQEFNRFYGKVPVLAAETAEQKRARLGVVQAFLFALKAGLGVLGVPVLERM